MTKPLSSIRTSKQTAIIEFLRKAWPAFGEEVFHLRERLRYARQFGPLQKKFWRDHYAPEKPAVLSGPFAGMKYLKGNVMGPPLPRWLGTYEAELHEVIRNLISRKAYEIILVVGSAEGFYSCGLARLFPRTPILSFEATAYSRWQQRRLLQLNGVRNVEVHGRLEAADFFHLLKNKKSLCLLDIEGAEVDFCGAAAAPWLERADLLVEIHAAGTRSPGQVLAEIKSALDPSHRIQVLDPVPRKMAEIRTRLNSPWSLEALQEAAEEHRGFAQQWLWAEARRD
jgi:hypothetical protein